MRNIWTLIVVTAAVGAGARERTAEAGTLACAVDAQGAPSCVDARPSASWG